MAGARTGAVCIGHAAVLQGGHCLQCVSDGRQVLAGVQARQPARRRHQANIVQGGARCSATVAIVANKQHGWAGGDPGGMHGGT